MKVRMIQTVEDSSSHLQDAEAVPVSHTVPFVNISRTEVQNGDFTIVHRVDRFYEAGEYDLSDKQGARFVSLGLAEELI